MSEENKNLDTPRKLAEQIVAVVERSEMNNDNKSEAMQLAYHMAFGTQAYLKNLGFIEFLKSVGKA